MVRTDLIVITLYVACFFKYLLLSCLFLTGIYERDIVPEREAHTFAVMVRMVFVHLFLLMEYVIQTMRIMFCDITLVCLVQLLGP